MRRSTDRIIVSHAGTLPRPEDLQQELASSSSDDPALQRHLDEAVAEVVRQQVDAGIDVVNDGEFAQRGGFMGYVRERMSGIAQHPLPAGSTQATGRWQAARDQQGFPGYYGKGLGGIRTQSQNAPNVVADPWFCVAPLAYTGQELVQADIERIKAATAGFDVEPFLCAIAPANIEHWLWNEHYANDEELLFAIADIMNEEYRAITDAGIAIQIDDPDLPDMWQSFPSMSVDEYRAYAELRVEAQNQALRGIPESLVRFHVCWGSQHAPHRADIPLRDIVDLILKVNAECYSIEAANARHEHEWQVWEDVQLPEGKSLMPGVIGHLTDVIEHPELVSQRLVRYANLVGRENVIAGTDCGIGSRVGHPEITWAKFEDMARGAELASKQLWGA